MLIGLTGQIGAGKSSVAGLLRELGATIIDADEIGKEVISDNPILLKQLVREFGDGILTRSGCLNTSALARRAFVDVRSTAALNRLVHPYLLNKLRRCMREHNKPGQIVVVDAALLHYWQLERELDLTITAYAPREMRLKRLWQRGIGRDDAKRRDKVQLPFAEMKRRSDVSYHSMH